MKTKLEWERVLPTVIMADGIQTLHADADSDENAVYADDIEGKYADKDNGQVEKYHSTIFKPVKKVIK